MILLDTHALIWADFGLNSLGVAALKAIDTAGPAGDLTVSAVSFWETAMLAAKGRIQLPDDPMRWRRSLLETGLRELPLTGDIGIRATQLQHLPPDPADRMICATALQNDATLVTADEAILAWQGSLQRLDARL